MMKKKSNKVEIEERKLYVSNLLLEGKNTKDICRIATEKWKICRRQVERYITFSYTNWHKQFDKKGESILEYNIALRMNLYNKSYDERKYRTCLAILKDMAKIEDYIIILNLLQKQSVLLSEQNVISLK